MKGLTDPKSYFAHMYITIKGKWSFNLVTLHQNLLELWPLFYLDFGKINNVLRITHERIDGSKWYLAHVYIPMKRMSNLKRYSLKWTHNRKWIKFGIYFIEPFINSKMKRKYRVTMFIFLWTCFIICMFRPNMLRIKGSKSNQCQVTIICI